MKHIAPSVFAKSFTCPHCGAISQQRWWMISLSKVTYSSEDSNEIRVGMCIHCEKHTMWLIDSMLFPTSGGAPLPNMEMPASVREYYVEASEIFSKSPRAAAALLRLGIQVLCKELGQQGENINNDIAALVDDGLPDVVQQSLDIVRVTGNQAVHPGQIDTDDPAVVASLFDLINIIVEYMIAMPKRVSGLYINLPANTLAAIKKRDA